MNLTTAEPAVTDGPESIQEVAAGPTEQMDSFWLTCLGVIPLLGLAPVMIVEVMRIWDRPHYRFAPLVWLAAVALIAVNFRDARPDRRRFLVASIIGAIGCVLGVLSIWFFMPRVAHLSLTIVLFAWLLGQLGETRWTRILALVAMVAVTIPWPLNLDISVMRALQGTAARCTSSVLDALGILHWLDGTTLNARYFSIPTTRVGGGPDSFLFFLGLAAIFAAIRRHGYVATILLFLSVPLWSIAYGVITQTALSIYGNSFTTSGHELPFLVVRVIVFASITMCFLLFEVSLLALTRPSAWSRLAEDDWLIEDEIMRYRPPIQYTSQQSLTRSMSLPIAAVLLVSGVIATFAIASNYDNLFTSKLSTQLAANVGDANALPEKVGDWQRSQYWIDTKLASGGYVIPQFNWRYSRGLENVTFSLTLGANETSPITEYEAQNWRAVEGENVLPPNVQLPCQVVQLKNAVGAQAFLMLSNINVAGQVVPDNAAAKEEQSLWRPIFSKLSEKTDVQTRQVFEVKVFYPTITEQKQVDIAAAGLVAALLQNVSQQTQAIFAPDLQSSKTPAP